MLPKLKNQKSQFIDSSRKRRPTNFHHHRPVTPFTGRRFQVYELMQELVKPQVRMVNYFGLEGIGKTRLLIETLQFLSERDVFKDGVFYIDLKDATTS